MLVTFNNVSLQYLDKVIFDKISFAINEGDKIGVVGINGSGKSTLLKTIMKEVEISSGNLFLKNGLKISYLPQEPHFNLENSIIKEVLEKTKVENDYEAKAVLSKLGLDEYDKKINLLSGGEKRRLSLAISLLVPCELLMLDEPTNHLDIWMINWLEQFLMKWNKALLLVTHDRYFLERITTKTLELELGKAYFYNANYSAYLLLKEERLQNNIASERKLKTLLKKEAVWASLNPQARSTKSKERLERFKTLSQEVSNQINRNSEINREMAFSSHFSRLGGKTIILENLSKQINGKILFKNFSYIVDRFDRLGIIGENGQGKTTLFKTILGEVLPDEGVITIGETVKIGYLKQEDEILNSDMKIIDYLKSYGEEIDSPSGTISASILLEEFMFSKNRQYMPISTLSGGEKRRLQILRVLITNPNILFLDEPTNDLDIYTLEILEDYLERFKGAVIVISHDRYFLDKVINHSFIYKDTSLIEYTGLISDYITTSYSKKKTINIPKPTLDIPRFTSSEKKEFDQIETKIMNQETKIKTLEDETYLCGSNYQKLLDLQKEISSEKAILDKMYERYEYLNNLNDEIEKYKREKLNGRKD